MKKIHLLTCCILVTSTCFSQFQKNDRLVSGQIYFNNSNNKSITNNAQTTNWGTGINIAFSRFSSATRYNSFNLSYAYSGNKQENGIGGLNKFANNQIGLAYGQTILSPLASRLYLSFPFSGGFSVTKGQNKNNNVLVSSGNSLALGLNAVMGLVYQTKKRWVFTANIISLGGISYNHSRIKEYNISGQVISESRSNSFNFTSGLSGTAFNNLAIGAGYLLK